MAKIKYSDIANAGEHAEKLDHSVIVSGNVKSYSHSGAEYGSFL